MNSGWPDGAGPVLRLCSWNINSVRLRLPLLQRLVQEAAPDVICLQETKCPDPLFPAVDCAAFGYPHQALAGMKGYNGVAILSRHPLQEIRVHDWGGKQDCRHISARVAGLTVHSLYIPAGGDEPDPAVNPKFAYKLGYLSAVAEGLRALHSPEDPAVLMGDFNVAPLPSDVWNHRRMLRIITHTPVEVDHLHRLQASSGWVDAAREFIPPDTRISTWWSYRAADWRAADKGRRLDHIWVTPVLKSRLAGYQVLSDGRDWAPPSDHAPVLLDLRQP